MKTNHTETQEGYGVLVTRKDGTKKLLMNGTGAYFTTERHCAKFYRNLEASDGHKCKVVKIRATWEVIG